MTKAGSTTAALAFFLALTACDGGEGPSDAGAFDAGTTDAGAFDAGAFDAGVTDAGLIDTDVWPLVVTRASSMMQVQPTQAS